MFSKLSRLLLIMLAVLSAGAILWLLLQVTTWASFSVPSHSMSPALRNGDMILVNKWLMGGRLFDLEAAFSGRLSGYCRLPGVAVVQRNDVLVFNDPFSQRKDSMTFDVMRYYVKRCLALPGDSIETVGGFYLVRGVEMALGNMEAQRQMKSFWESVEPSRRRRMGYRGLNGWNVLDWGPLYVPRVGDSLSWEVSPLACYRRCIEWELGCRLTHTAGKYYLDGVPFTGYRFRHDYYFMAGDNCLDSRDSRYWGLVPEPFIVGKATRIWMSRDPESREIRWRRVWKKIE